MNFFQAETFSRRELLVPMITFDFEWKLGFLLLCMTVWPSHWTAYSCWVWPSSFKNRFIHNISLLSLMTTMYSNSIVESATHFYISPGQDTTPPSWPWLISSPGAPSLAVSACTCPSSSPCMDHRSGLKRVTPDFTIVIRRFFFLLVFLNIFESSPPEKSHLCFGVSFSLRIP